MGPSRGAVSCGSAGVQVPSEVKKNLGHFVFVWSGGLDDKRPQNRPTTRNFRGFTSGGLAQLREPPRDKQRGNRWFKRKFKQVLGICTLFWSMSEQKFQKR